jgi:hypothetical protein
MTRFDAATEDARCELFADAIRAHDERDSAFLTIETAANEGSADEDEDESVAVPWVQFADGMLNLDCTDAELSRLKSLLASFSTFTIDALDSPEDVEGTNVRVAARTDPERVAEFIERVFIEVYEQSEDYQAWVTAV